MHVVLMYDTLVARVPPLLNGGQTRLPCANILTIRPFVGALRELAETHLGHEPTGVRVRCVADGCDGRLGIIIPPQLVAGPLQ